MVIPHCHRSLLRWLMDFDPIFRSDSEKILDLYLSRRRSGNRSYSNWHTAFKKHLVRQGKKLTPIELPVDYYRKAGMQARQRNMLTGLRLSRLLKADAQ